MREFYVSAEGDDRNNGLTPGSAWRTLYKVSRTIFLPGDRVRLRRGDAFLGPLRIYVRARQASERCVVEAYGDDARGDPIISCYKWLDPGGWEQVQENVWRFDVNDVRRLGGLMRVSGAPGANIGALRVDGELRARRRSDLADLAADWDFYCDNERFLYVRCSGAPGEIARQILASPRVTALGGGANVEFRHLDIIGAGAHGGQWAAKSNIAVKFCHFHEIGGAYLSGSVRFGNGLEFWVGCRDIEVSRCLFGDIYDAATTVQGYPLRTERDGWDNVVVGGSYAYRCSQAFEIWARYALHPSGTGPRAGAGFRNVRALDWTLFDIGRGAFADVRPVRYDVAPFLIHYNEAPVVDVAVSIAEMRNCGDRLIAAPGVLEIPKGYRLAPSNLRLAPGQLLTTSSSLTASDWAAWKNTTGLGEGSVLKLESERALTPRSIVRAKWQNAVAAND